MVYTGGPGIYLAVSAVTLGALIFAVDLLIPLGIAVGIAYVAVVFLAVQFPQQRYALLATFVCSLLIVVAFLTADSSSSPLAEIANRLLALFTIWVTATVLLLRKRAQEDLNSLNASLKQRVEDRTLELSRANGELEAEIEEREQVEAALRQSEETQRLLAEENATVAEIGRIISSSLHIDEVYEKFALEMKKLLDFDRVVINTINYQEGVFVIAYHFGLAVRGRSIGDRVPLKNSSTEWAVLTGRPVVREDMAEGGFSGDEVRLMSGVHSSITIPLFVKGEVIGVLSLQSCRIGAYGPKHQITLERLANQIAPAVENARLYEGARRAQENLEVRVEERTQDLTATNHRLLAEIAERQRVELELQAARDQALEASRAKSDFLSSMSHEIRTPMNTIIGMAESLEQTPLIAKQEQYVRVLHRSGETLLALINDILDLSKVEAGQIELEEVEFDLIQLVEDTAESFGQRARENGLELNCHVAPEVPSKVVGDPVRLSQVISNLLSNAIKFTKQGRVALQAELDPEDISGAGSVWFRIFDTGVGIPAEKLTTIFDSFTQADTSTTREYGGTGLGLTICKRLAELMGGRIWVESAVGEGSGFHFSARFAAPVANSGQLPRASEAAPQARTALIVDDNAGLCRFLKHLLNGWGFVATSVEKGSDAIIELARGAKSQEPYQLLLLDRCLPDMDGLEVAAHIRENVGLADLSIIMITALGDGKDVIASQQPLSISLCLLKPFKQSDLFQAVAATLGFEAVGERPRSAQAAKPRSDQRALRILLVDDYEDNWLVVEAHLEDTPYRIEIAANGEIAVDMFKADKFDLVLMDVQMPVLDGYTATRKIRQWELEQGLAQTPIFALTANALTEDAQQSLEAGCTAHITKPLKRAALLEAIGACASKEVA